MVKAVNIENYDKIKIIDKSINNPGGGDCAFYAFAIGMINIIQEEEKYDKTSMFDLWVKLDSSLKPHYLAIIDFDIKRPNNNLLMALQKSLRRINYSTQVQELQVLCANPKENYKQLVGSGNFLNFAELFYNDKKYRDNANPLYNPYASSIVIKKAIKSVPAVNKESFEEVNNALVPLFLSLFYGKDIDLDTVTPETEPCENSPIIASMSRILRDRFWGTHLDLVYLSNAFGVELNVLINGVEQHPPVPLIKIDLDVRQRHIITLNNSGNFHWTTRVNVPTALIQEPEAESIAKEGIQKKDLRRIRQINSIRVALNPLHIKIMEFKRQGLRNKDYAKAMIAMEHIKSRVEALCSQYEYTMINLEHFKQRVHDVLTDEDCDDLYVLKQHRGWKDIVFNIVVALATLGVAHLLYSAAEGQFTLFSTKTDSEELISSLDESVFRVAPLR